MKHVFFLLLIVFLGSDVLHAEPMEDHSANFTCTWNAWFKYPKSNNHFKQGKSVYVRVDPQKYHDIAYMELYVDGKYIRKESMYPYEWCKNGGGDHYLKNLSCGKHHLKVKIRTKCGSTHYKEIYIYVDCNNGGGHDQCSSAVAFNTPSNNAHFKKGQPVYVKMVAQKHQDIAYMELYIDGKFIRKESNHPFEWGKGNTGDHYLRNLTCGKHQLKVKIHTKCGSIHYNQIYIYVDCHDDGGHHDPIGHCQWDSWFKYPKNNGHYQEHQDIYVRVDPKNYQDIAHMELYVDGKFIRKESTYPYEWCKGSGNSDSYLRHLSCGKHIIKVKIVDKCGNIHYKQICILIDCHDQAGGGGHHDQCEADAWFKYPISNTYHPARKPLYVRVDPKKYPDIVSMELFVDGKLVRKETSYPFEWCRPHALGDNELRNLSPGRHQLKVKIVDKCGNINYERRWVRMR